MKLNTTPEQNTILKFYRLKYFYLCLVEVSKDKKFKKYLKGFDAYEFIKLRENCYSNVTCYEHTLIKFLEPFRVRKGTSVDRHVVFYALCKYFLLLDSDTRHNILFKVVAKENAYLEALNNY